MKLIEIQTDLQSVYDELAKDWRKDGSLEGWGYEELLQFSSLVEQVGGSRVLDLGCGAGAQSKLLREKGFEVVGLDLSEGMIRESKQRVPEGEFVVGDMIRLPFSPASFDGVYARASLLHIPKDMTHQVIRSIREVVRPNGILYLALKEGEGEREVKDKKYDREVKRFFSFFKMQEIIKQLKEESFSLIEAHQDDRHPTTWLHVFAAKA